MYNIYIICISCHGCTIGEYKSPHSGWHVSDFHSSSGANLSSTSLVCVIRDTVAVSASHSFAERGAAQRSCNMSSSQCGSKSQPVLLHCERSTPADGEKNLPAASDATPGQKRVHHPAKIPKRTEPARSALAVLNCSTPARALSSSSFSTSVYRSARNSSFINTS